MTPGPGRGQRESWRTLSSSWSVSSSRMGLSSSRWQVAPLSGTMVVVDATRAVQCARPCSQLEGGSRRTVRPGDTQHDAARHRSERRRRPSATLAGLFGVFVLLSAGSCLMAPRSANPSLARRVTPDAPETPSERKKPAGKPAPWVSPQFECVVSPDDSSKGRTIQAGKVRFA